MTSSDQFRQCRAPFTRKLRPFYVEASRITSQSISCTKGRCECLLYIRDSLLCSINMRDVLPRSLVSLRRVDRTCYAVHTSTQNYFVVSSLTLNSCAFVSLSSKMPPHGAGMCGATHSHSVEFPDDNWNLYSMLDTTTVTALNVTRPADAVGIFKPFVHRLSIEPELISDSDEEIIVS